MYLKSLIGHCAHLLKIAFKSPSAPDNLASQFFRQKKYIGSKERAFISESFFLAIKLKLTADFLIRKQYLIEQKKIEDYKEKIIVVTVLQLSWLLKPAIAEHLKNTILILFKTETEFEIALLDYLTELFISRDAASTFLKAIKAGYIRLSDESMYSETAEDENVIEKISLRNSIPDWILRDLHENRHTSYSIQKCAAIAESLLEPPPVTLRVNEAAIDRNYAIESLSKSEINCKMGRLSPVSLILNKRMQLNTNELFKRGLIEVQDESSQLAAFALAPKEGERILDACAGAGGKTLHLASICRDKCRIISSDTEILRLKEIRKRASRFGFKSITTLLLKNGASPKELSVGFNAVLVDAPCSGTGVLRRQPMQKWKISPESIRKQSAKQLEILEFYSKTVKKGGRLVYSTCSLLPEENDEVVENFLKRNPEFHPSPFYHIFASKEINIPTMNEDTYKLSITPDMFGSDGFFISKFIRE